MKTGSPGYTEPTVLGNPSTLRERGVFLLPWRGPQREREDRPLTQAALRAAGKSASRTSI